MRAIAVLSFLLLPPLQSRHTHSLPTLYHLSVYISSERERVDSPVLPTLSIPILCEVQLVDGGGDHISDARLWNTSQSGKHGQQLSPCHPLYQSIKLRTVANQLLDLRPTVIKLSYCKYRFDGVYVYVYLLEVGSDIIASNVGRSLTWRSLSCQNAECGGLPCPYSHTHVQIHNALTMVTKLEGIQCIFGRGDAKSSISYLSHTQ